MNIANPRVVAIVLNYRNPIDSIKCLQSIKDSDYSNLRTIFVDNHSQDDSISRIRELFPSIEIVETTKNLGYSGGNNAGIKIALKNPPEYTLIVNNDVVLDKSCISELIKVAESDSRIGVLGTLVHDMNDRLRITGRGGKVNLWLGLNYDANPKRDLNLTPDLWKVDYVSGSTMLIRVETINKIGILRDDFEFYWEDTDFCFRASRAGYLVCVTAKASSWHKSGTTTKKIPNLRLYYDSRNRIYFERLHANRIQKLFFLCQYLWLDTIMRLFYLTLRDKSIEPAYIIFRAIFDGLNHQLMSND